MSLGGSLLPPARRQYALYPIFLVVSAGMSPSWRLFVASCSSSVRPLSRLACFQCALYPDLLVVSVPFTPSSLFSVRPLSRLACFHCALYPEW